MPPILPEAVKDICTQPHQERQSSRFNFNIISIVTGFGLVRAYLNMMIPDGNQATILLGKKHPVTVVNLLEEY